LRRHLHLHVLSKDLISPYLKNKKHYNSFSPTLGFFLHLSTVREWLESTFSPLPSPLSPLHVGKDGTMLPTD
jgi:hypothetical protein